MHIEKINYQKTFNLGNYTSEKIGVEIALHQGESATKALNIAKELVEEYHLENLKKNPIVVDVETEPIIQTQSPKTLVEKTKQFIDDCKNEVELKAWKIMANSNSEIMKYYSEKLESFKNNVNN